MTFTLPAFAISTLDQQLASVLLHKINQKTKPLGALGMLEHMALKIGLIQSTLTPSLHAPTMLVFAGDHGIVAEGVSPFPQAVTAQMVQNFLNGGAAINVFARQHGFALQVIDSGVNHTFIQHPALVDAKIVHGTANFLYQPAMTQAQCEYALTFGANLARKTVEEGSNVLAFGEMGIGNTSSASCLMSVLCDLPIQQCVGRGTGLDDAGLNKKSAVLQAALEKHAIDSQNPMQVLATFGGAEIAMMVGAMLGAAQTKAILLIDGFIATAALLVASKLQPSILEYCIFSHCSDEAGHQHLLQHLGAQPLLNIGLRLGEGTGAVLAYPLVQAAVNFLNEMASFESAGVSEKLDAS
ncbi:MAG TPA: nicotinate-nucleotide--dimethylbenzimidazole phosphoribosyltransferase [Methylophilaceae bacterium]|nr:nicotinate-nucleotide--dimethylbenzimidazole phosphoribosyltransferase [Methylophilaceae bacterium]HAJ70816.1 nicotinate-nucleotide--dimethylbenzimidazole phosphoribosyltransferase [Methylophilaceae bacterium]